MNSEWSIPDPAFLVRQGDILICRDRQKGLIEEICIVITADCDISKGKFGRQLACLRIVTFEKYLRTVWPVRKLSDTVDNATAQIQARLNKWNTERIGAKSSLSAESVTAWVLRDDPEKICDDLNIPKKEKKKFESALTSFRAALEALNDELGGDKLKQLTAFRAAIKSMDIKKCWEETLQQAQNEKLPDDVFLLPSLPQLDNGPAVILLRELVGVSLDTVCYRTYDADTNEKFLRIGRLEPIFKYAVSQAFGTLYSRIGLPEDYERRCKEIANQINEITWE